jgi:Domain of unknown function (DUF4388)
MKPEGSLAERDVPELVQVVHERRWTGTLTLTHMGVGKSVNVQDGRLVFASSTSPDERLGELLLRRGKITLRQLSEAGAAVQPGKRLGTILVERGQLSPKGLVKAVTDQTQEIIYGAFLWTEGRYRMQEQAASSEAITLKISTPEMILEGIRRIEAWSRIDRGVGGLQAQYARADRYDEALRGLVLPPEKSAILTSLEGTRTVDAICSGSSLGSFEVCRTLWAYRVIGVVRRVDTPAPKPEAEDEGFGLVLAG